MPLAQIFDACMLRDMHGGEQHRRRELHWTDQLAPAVGRLRPDSVSVNYVDRILRSAVSMGASRPKLLAAIDVQDAALRNPIGRVPQSVLIDLFITIEREFGDPAIGMRMATAAKPASFSDLGFVAIFASTIGEMMQSIVNIQGFRQNVWKVELDITGRPAKLRWNVSDSDAHRLESCLEFSAASYAHLYTSALPTRMAPQMMYLRHQPRFSEATYAELLGCPVVFGAQETRMEFSRSQFGLPLPRACPLLQHRIQETYAQAVRWMAEGRRYTALSFLYLASELNKSPLKLERLAASFAMSERSLRRKLVEEGYPFRQLLEKVRRDLCDLYRMEGSRTMGEVAEQLGYSELSAFTRAHKGWYGVSPRQVMRESIDARVDIKGENGGRSKD